MRLPGLAFGALIAVALVACDTPFEPVAEPGVDIPAPSFSRVGPVIESVTGSAKFHRTLRSGETYWHVSSLTARRYADGSVKGMYNAVGNTGPYRGRVHCFTVVGNEAWLGVIVERSKNAPPSVGDVRVVYVMDNGEGAGDPPDRSTAFPPLGITGLPDLDAYCAETPEIRASSVFDLEAGNIQIHKPH